jgi:hypothetical protein
VLLFRLQRKSPRRDVVRILQRKENSSDCHRSSYQRIPFEK